MKSCACASSGCSQWKVTRRLHITKGDTRGGAKTIQLSPSSLIVKKNKTLNCVLPLPRSSLAIHHVAFTSNNIGLIAHRSPAEMRARKSTMYINGRREKMLRLHRQDETSAEEDGRSRTGSFWATHEAPFLPLSARQLTALMSRSTRPRDPLT